ncbi:hypothetical protein RYH80_00255 [Halobaculum sp. MBLA0147]|uniref:hypothetical protein n=1 Tax=Halobaculum sp. MBLA0147 TaxID=3079934 RepID=UPI0035239D1C
MSDESGSEFEHHVEDGVVVQDLTRWNGADGLPAAVVSDWNTYASEAAVTGAATLLGAGTDAATVRAVVDALVAAEGVDSVRRLAISVPGGPTEPVAVETETVAVRRFGDEEGAIAWARG